MPFREPSRNMMQRWRAGFWAVMLPAVCLVGWLGEGCSAQAPVTRIVCGSCEEPERFVRLQRYPPPHRSNGQGGFSHPFRLSPQDWKPIVASVHIQVLTSAFVFFYAKQPETPAFTPEEVEYLSTTLSKAFAEAQPEEWVVFGLSHPRLPDLTEMTTGGWFRDGDNLHFVLANYRCPVSMPSIRERLKKDPLSPNTGGTFVLSLKRHQSLVKDSHVLGRLVGSDPAELSIAYQPLLSAEATSPPPTAGSSTPPQTTPSSSLEERLEMLKRLREQGLITQEDYEAKKKQLLEKF